VEPAHQGLELEEALGETASQESAASTTAEDRPDDDAPEPAQDTASDHRVGIAADRRRSATEMAEEDDEDALLEAALLNETRPMGLDEELDSEEDSVSSISPLDDRGSVWDGGDRSTSSGGESSLAAAQSIEGDEGETWASLLLPWNWWK